MGFDAFTSLTLVDILVSTVVVGIMFFVMANAVAQRMSYVTTTVVHRAYAHEAWQPAYIVRLFADYTMGRMGVWEAFWVVRHRDHHSDTDLKKDPHSPWNILSNFIKNKDEQRKDAVLRLENGENLVMYRDVEDQEAYVAAHGAPIRTTFLDDFLHKWPTFGPLLSVHIMAWATHVLPYLGVAWLLNQLGVNPALFIVASLGVAIGSLAHGGGIYIKLSAEVNARGHAWPVRSKVKPIGNASNSKRARWKIFGTGELLQFDHHFRQRSARIRCLEGTTWRDDVGYEIIRALKMVRLARKVKVDERTTPGGRRFIDRNLDPVEPKELELAA